MGRNTTMRRRHASFFTYMKTKIQIYLVISQIFCTFGIRPKVLSFENEKKIAFFFCILLTYSYLCKQLKSIVYT